MAHRRTVVIAWIVAAIGILAVSSAVGKKTASSFTLPGTNSQQAVDLLQSRFPAQAGDSDQIVFHARAGTLNNSTDRAAIDATVARVARLPHVTSVVGPYAPGQHAVSRDGTIAFATVNFDERANALPKAAVDRVLSSAESARSASLDVQLGGQAIEQAQQASLGFATVVGIAAAILILLISFGSFSAMWLPIATALLGLSAGIGVINLASHVVDMPSFASELALMIGLGVGVDYALFIVTRFRENYGIYGDVDKSVVEAMDTSGRAILLAGTTVVIALLGMFATGVSFLYGLSIASILAVLMTMVASLTVLPAMLSRFGHRVVRQRSGRRRLFGRRGAEGVDEDVVLKARSRSRWREWSRTVQRRPWPLALLSLGLMIALLLPVIALRLESSDAGNDPSGTKTRQAFDLLADGFGAGFNGPLLIVTELPSHNQTTGLPSVQAAVKSTPNVVAVTPYRVSPAGNVAVFEAYPGSAPQAAATTDLVNHLRADVLPPLKHQTGATVLVGGFTAGSIDFSHVLSQKLPLFIGIVVVLSALLLFVMFRSIVIPIQAALMNLLSIGGALGVTVLVFQEGWFASVLGVEKGPVEPWIPVLMFAVVFGLSMDYEVFLISRVREQWIRKRDASEAVADGIAFTGRVITAAAAIMICVFLSFMFGNQRVLKEFGFGLAAAVLLDAIVVRCVLLPAVLELLGPTTWKLPRWLDARLPHINIEGESAHAQLLEEPGAGEEREPEPAQV